MFFTVHLDQSRGSCNVSVSVSSRSRPGRSRAHFWHLVMHSPEDSWRWSFSDARRSPHHVVRRRSCAWSAAYSKPNLSLDKHVTSPSAKCFSSWDNYTPYPTVARWRLRRHTGSRVRRRPRRLLCPSTVSARRRRRQPSCNVFSTQLRESCQTAASTTDDWPISGAMFYNGSTSLTGSEYYVESTFSLTFFSQVSQDLPGDLPLPDSSLLYLW